MTAHAGTIVNALAAVASGLIWGPLWGGLVFLAVALVRMALEVQAVRSENMELRALLADGLESADDPRAGPEGAPDSEVRPRMPSLTEVRASQSG